jgi:hypothetical protein
MNLKGNYIETLKKRSKESRAYSKYQLAGLEIAELLSDRKHKSLYIKLAKENNQTRLMQLAKDIAERSGIKNKGAYFMKIWQAEKKK